MTPTTSIEPSTLYGVLARPADAVRRYRLTAFALTPRLYRALRRVRRTGEPSTLGSGLAFTVEVPSLALFVHNDQPGHEEARQLLRFIRDSTRHPVPAAGRWIRPDGVDGYEAMEPCTVRARRVEGGPAVEVAGGGVTATLDTDQVAFLEAFSCPEEALTDVLLQFAGSHAGYLVDAIRYGEIRPYGDDPRDARPLPAGADVRRLVAAALPRAPASLRPTLFAKIERRGGEGAVRP